MRRSLLGSAGVIAVATASIASGQVDNLTLLVDNALAAEGGIVIACAYDPATDTAYSAISVLSGADDGAMIRRITGVSTASPIATTVLTRDQISYFMREGDLTRTLRSAAYGGMTFNPAPVGSIGTRGSLWLIDGGVTRLPNGSTVTDPYTSKRIYRYTLGDVPAPGNDYPSVATVLKPLTTMAAIQTAAGFTPSTADVGMSRQLAFSPDGQHLYGVSTSADMGGVYRVNASTGAVARLLPFGVSAGCEPAVVKIGGVDRVYFASPNNVGGVSYVDHNPSSNTTSAETVLLTAAQLKTFMQVAINPVVSNFTSDSAGNLYFFDGFGTNGNYRLLKYDTQGRLSKVSTRVERDQYFTGDINDGFLPSVQQLKLQAYSYVDSTAGAVTRISYLESTPVGGIAAVTAYKTADFNRDGLENAADLALFAPKITASNVVSSINDARFDLNGNRSIDFNDVMTLKQFIPFRVGDANLSQTVNFDDLLTLAQNYGMASGAYWTLGDFDGSGGVGFDDLLALAQNYNAPLLTGSFASEWALAQSLVPEPGSISLAVLLLAGTRRRR